MAQCFERSVPVACQSQALEILMPLEETATLFPLVMKQTARHSVLINRTSDSCASIKLLMN